MSEYIILGKGNSAKNIAFLIDKKIPFKFKDLKEIKKESIKKFKKKLFIISYAKNLKLRSDTFEFIKKKKLKLANILCKSSIIHSSVKIKNGCVVESFVKVFNGSIVGENVMIEAGSTIGSFNKIGKNTVIAQHVNTGAKVLIGSNCMIGMGATITPNCKIGNNCFISANETIRNKIPNNSIVFKGKILKKDKLLDKYFE